MTFEEYVDTLAKRGIIDGHITEMLIGKHRDEVANPLAEIRDKVSPILDEMFHAAKLELRGFAERIDDELTQESR